MTKEELKQEAEVYADDKKHFDGQAQLYIVDGYLAGAEPREKRIAELEKENAELKESGSVICDRLSERIDEIVELKNENIGLKKQIAELEKENAELIGKVAFLENDLNNAKAQIEEMKCCLSTWYEYENERDTPQINIDELLIETQQFIS